MFKWSLSMCTSDPWWQWTEVIVVYKWSHSMCVSDVGACKKKCNWWEKITYQFLQDFVPSTVFHTEKIAFSHLPHSFKPAPSYPSTPRPLPWQWQPFHRSFHGLGLVVPTTKGCGRGQNYSNGSWARQLLEGMNQNDDYSGNFMEIPKGY